MPREPWQRRSCHRRVQQQSRHSLGMYPNQGGVSPTKVYGHPKHGPSLGDFSLKLEIVEDLTNM